MECNVRCVYRKRTAIVSPCGQFRYSLDRLLDLNTDERLRINFIMLNPSKADGTVDDPTIRRCVGFASRLGFNELRVGNLFAYRATDPLDLAANGWQVGPDNQRYLHDMAVTSAVSGEPIVLAWGAEVRKRPFVAVAAIEYLKVIGAHLFTLRTLADGTPAHPLMLPYSCVLTPWGK